MFNISIYKNIFGSCIKGDSSSFLNSSFPLSSIGYLLPYLPPPFIPSALLSLPFIVFHQCFFPPLSSLLPLLILPFFSFMIFSFSPPPFTFSSPPFFCLIPVSSVGTQENTRTLSRMHELEVLNISATSRTFNIDAHTRTVLRSIDFLPVARLERFPLGMPYRVYVLVTQKSTFFPA